MSRIIPQWLCRGCLRPGSPQKTPVVAERNGDVEVADHHFRND